MAAERTRLARWVTVVVTGVWAASMFADIAIAAYTPSPFVHAAMAAVVGALFGQHAIRGPRK